MVIWNGKHIFANLLVNLSSIVLNVTATTGVFILPYA